MNVLILTPDRVGSTLLQRVLTVLMLQKGFDKPVINLHELSNGLRSYYNTALNQEVLGKPTENWGYYQSLEEVISLLESADHYKTSRLAHYHLLRRNDTIQSQLKFYEYLNKNFYIISCRRTNLFEHALSWAINGHSKQLNVYHPFDKIKIFEEIYKNGITVSEETLKNHLTRYKNYIEWSDKHFNIQTHFNYEDFIGNVDSYIMNLDFMKNSNNVSWSNTFNQSFDDFNTCHKLIPDIKLYENRFNQQADITVNNITMENSWNNIKGVDWPEFKMIENGSTMQGVPAAIKAEIQQLKDEKNSHINSYTTKTDLNVINYLTEHAEKYKNTFSKIQSMVTDGYLVTGIPIKLQTLSEKRSIIKNYESCITWYNQWVAENNYGKPYTEEELDMLAKSEDQKFNYSLALSPTNKLISKNTTV